MTLSDQASPAGPNGIIQDMYLQINNIAQGVNLGLFVLVLVNSTPDQWFSPLNYSRPIFALVSFSISVVFWARYYFDTEILKRSFTVLSVIWFFAYLISQGVSISCILVPPLWLASTGVFLFLGAGFYVLNLLEIRRKQQAGILSALLLFHDWQRRRMVELFIISGMTLAGAFLVKGNATLALPASLVALAVAIWQMAITGDYRRCRFIETGL
jgi:hypothetical protein